MGSNVLAVTDEPQAFARTEILTSRDGESGLSDGDKDRFGFIELMQITRIHAQFRGTNQHIL
jgi:hypothetical protein